MQRPLFYFLLGIVLFGIAWSIHEPDPAYKAVRATADLQQGIERALQEVRLIAANEAAFVQEKGGDRWMVERLPVMEQERIRTGTVVFGLQGDSVSCWSGRSPLTVNELIDAHGPYLVLPQGIHLHASVERNGVSLHALRPIWTEPPIENRYLASGFHPSFHAPAGLLVSNADRSGPTVVAEDGTPIFHVAWREGAMEVGPWLWLHLIFVVIAVAFLVLGLWRSAMELVTNGRRWPGILLFGGALFSGRWLLLMWAPSTPIHRLPLFDPALYAASTAFPSLGDLLINAALLVAVAAFIQVALRGYAPGRSNALTMFVAWSLCLAHAAWITQLFIGLVNDSSVDLDLYHVQGLSGASAVALFSVALLFSSWVLLLATMLRTYMKDMTTLLWSGAVALAISIMLHHRYGIVDTLLFLWPVPLIIVLMAADRIPRFLQALIGVAMVAGISTHILTKYTGNREHRERAVLAERLAVREDPVVEVMFRELAPRLRAATELYGLLNGEQPCGPAELDQRIRQRYFSGYWERYDVRLFAFSPTGQALCATAPNPPKSFGGQQSEFTLPTVTVDMPDLFMQEQPGQSTFYHARIAVMPNDSIAPAQLVIELHPRSVAQGLGFPDLLLSGDDPLMRRADRYVQARYESGQLVDRSSGVAYPLRWTRTLNADGSLWYTEGGYEHLAKGHPEGTLLVLGLAEPDLTDLATTFSYFFAFFSVLLSIIVFIHMVRRSHGPPVLGIGAKVRVALGLFSLIGLAFFGWGTQRLLTRQYVQRFESAILEKARSVHAELQQRFDGEGPLGAAQIPYLDHLLGRASNVFFTDITLYTTNGTLLATSRPQVFATGLLGRRMDPEAYRQVVLKNASSFVHEESIGSADFLSAYMPLRDNKGQVLAYLALPSFADQAQREEERSGVLVAVVNLFVLLFALSVLVAVFISNWTTRPLDLLKRSLAAVALGGSNRPIRYRGQDEVGQLVEVYNRKVEELRESAEKLARSERETAWREMARQVAHEIKNPLTPMKLGIQHFQRTWAPDEPDASQRLQRFSASMVEQIDALSGIASAFSDFARMPRANAEDLDLAEVAGIAVDVFHGTPNAHFTIERDASVPMRIHADREQLLRVFNNLLKNAMQAVPDEREARIRVVLGVDGEDVIADVHDNGVGIAEADRERIFQPNFTTKNSGMGLGLAMVQRIVENAGGTVGFTTSTGEGSCFRITLPRVQ